MTVPTIQTIQNFNASASKTMETILSLKSFSIALALPARAERALKMCFVALLNHRTFRLYFGHHLLLYFIKILSGSRLLSAP